MRYKALAEYYDAEYAELPMLRHDVPFFLGQLPKRRQFVLELCVGTARAAIPIAQAGPRVVGVDYDADLLAIARQKRDAVGLKDQLDLRRADVRKLRLGQKFDWIAIFFNTLLPFPTLDEQDALLANVPRHLKPRGRFWIDVFQPDLRLLTGETRKGFDPRIFFVPHLQRTVFQTTDIQRDIARQTQLVTFNYIWFDSFGRRHAEKTSSK